MRKDRGIVRMDGMVLNSYREPRRILSQTPHVDRFSSSPGFRS